MPRIGYGRYLKGGVAAGGIVLVTVLLSSLRPAVPAVDRETLLVDSVRRGDMVRDVRGTGTLVPEHMRFVTALAAGRVERILVQPGQVVSPGTVLLELSNPDVQIQSLQAEQQLTAAEGALVQQRTSFENEGLSQSGVVATTRTEYLKATRDAVVAESLGVLGGLSRNEVAQAREKASELEVRYRIEQERLALLARSRESQLAVLQSQVERLRAIAAFQRNMVRSLNVRAGDSGVVSDLTLQYGQYVLAGTLLARVVRPDRLKAVLQIPETQAKDVAIGQRALIDMRSEVIPGLVARIDPNAINGTVAIEVTLDQTPAGARPDLSIEGTVEVERLRHVLYMGRPAYGRPNGTVGMFKITGDGRYAIRVSVHIGRSSVTMIEVVRGLHARDSVILSDMSQWESAERLRIKR